MKRSQKSTISGVQTSVLINPLKVENKTEKTGKPMYYLYVFFVI